MKLNNLPNNMFPAFKVSLSKKKREFPCMKVKIDVIRFTNSNCWFIWEKKIKIICYRKKGMNFNSKEKKNKDDKLES